MHTLVRTNSKDPAFIALVDELNAWLRVKDGDKHTYYNQFNSIEGIPYVLVIYDKSAPIACGAMKEYDPQTVEIKRMYTQPGARGKGIGKLIVTELENWARKLGYTRLLLETGKSFKAAIALYQKYGFEQIPNYDQYIGINESVCFQKPIV